MNSCRPPAANSLLSHIHKKPRLISPSDSTFFTPSPNSDNLFERLTYDSLLRIFHKVDACSQARLRRVCRRWNKILKSLQVRQLVILDFPFLAANAKSLHHHHKGTILLTALALDRQPKDTTLTRKPPECDLCLSLLNTVLKPTRMVSIVNSATGKMVALAGNNYAVAALPTFRRKEKLCRIFWEVLIKALSTNTILLLDSVAVRFHDLVTQAPKSFVVQLVMRNVRICGISSQPAERDLRGFAVNVGEHSMLRVENLLQFVRDLWLTIDENTPPLDEKSVDVFQRIQDDSPDHGKIFRDIIRTREPELDHEYFDWQSVHYEALKNSTALEIVTAYQCDRYAHMTDYYDRYDIRTEKCHESTFGKMSSSSSNCSTR